MLAFVLKCDLKKINCRISGFAAWPDSDNLSVDGPASGVFSGSLVSLHRTRDGPPVCQWVDDLRDFVVRLLLVFTGTCRTKKTWPKSFSQEELKKRLSPIQFHVTQERGTESAFRGEYTEYKEDGIYTCVVCGAPLFKSETKFDSGSGWPSFYDLVKEESVTVTDDFAYGMHRVETSCSQCGSHLGHLFDDGPRPTGKRYCINSASLGFQSASASASSPPSNGDGTGAGAGPGGAVGGKTKL